MVDRTSFETVADGDVLKEGYFNEILESLQYRLGIVTHDTSPSPGTTTTTGSEVTLHTETIAADTISKYAIVLCNLEFYSNRSTGGSNAPAASSVVIKIKVNGVEKYSKTASITSMGQDDNGPTTNYSHPIAFAIDTTTDWTASNDVILTVNATAGGTLGTLSMTLNSMLIVGGIASIA